jgi:hypothetical protein
MMFSGARPTLKELSSMFFPLPIVPNISFLRWAQEAIYLSGSFSFIIMLWPAMADFRLSTDNVV